MKDKILNILIISLLFLIAFQYFSKQDTQKVVSDGGLQITSSAKSYTIPADVKFVFDNTLSTSLTISPCQDISILFQGKQLEIPQKLCSDFQVSPGSKYTYDLSAMYIQLENAGDYTFEIHYQDQRYIIPVKIENKGTFGKMFVGLFYAPIFNLMVFLLELFSHSLGWAIIAITIIIRLLLLWPQHQMMISQKKLQNIQPKIKQLQDKHKGDSQTLGLELMKLYKDEQVNPMGSCGFLVIQLPILLVIYNVITSIRSPHHLYYLYSMFENFKIESISSVFFGVDLFSVGGISGIVLGLFVGIAQFIQVKLSTNFQQTGKKTGLVLEKKQGESDYNSLMPDPEFMNKFMLYGMPAMVAVFSYSFFLGVGMYWGISTVFSIFQQLIVNKILKK